MTSKKNPAGMNGGAFGNVLAGRLNNPMVTTTAATLQRHRRSPPPRLIGWTVDSWLGVSPIWEVSHGR